MLRAHASGFTAFSSAGVLIVALAGCEGDRGPPGPPGPGGVVDVTQEIPESLSVEISSVKISSPPVVEFRVTDGRGRGAVGLEAGGTGNVRFTLAKLVPGLEGDPDQWQSYINRAMNANGTRATVATYERDGPLEDHGDGSYTYTFLTDPRNAKDPVTGATIGYEPMLTHRLGMQVAGGGLPPANQTTDFVPNGTAVKATRDIAATASCNECHGTLLAHGNTRYDVKYCVTCHNPGASDPASGASSDMMVLAHKIHAPGLLLAPYVLFGHDYSEVTYPQDLRNCRKCHTAADAATPDGDNWKERPSLEACGSCHEGTSFTTPTPPGKVRHTGGPQADNNKCGLCHPAEAIEEYHLTENATPNNPGLPFGYSVLSYEILEVTVNESLQPVVAFRILRDGTPLDLLDLPEDLTASGTYPSFLLSYAGAQDGIAKPADYNNLGRSAGQPATVGLGTLIAGTGGSLAEGEGDGVFIATTNAAFPEGATLRAVALQGYFNQTSGTANVARHTFSVVKAVTGDAARREVVESQKCLACHETIAAHGGNRVDNAAVCVTCHLPNLSSSGRAVETPNDTIVAQLGPDPLQYPEATNNLKDMIHGIHASAVRTTAYEFVRNRNAGIYYDWSEVTFPGDPADCLACHKPGTFGSVPAGALATTDRTTTGDPDETRTDVVAARDGVPNATDVVITPIAAACFSCHDGPAAVAHMQQNGGAVRWERSDVLSIAPTETCGVCHGNGKIADVSVVHGGE